MKRTAFLLFLVFLATILPCLAQAGTEQDKNKAVARRFFEQVPRKAVPDLHLKINEIIAERDLVLVYWTASGTNTHEGMGFSATGKSFTEPGMTLFRFKAGKMIEEWGVWSMLSIMQQLGLLPQQ